MNEKSLEEIIVERISCDGPISFRDFMDMCLYHSLGYYSGQRQRVGADGDYYTSVAFTSLFGRLIGRQIEEIWELLGKDNFTIVEYGAGSGQLCRDIMHYLELNPKLFRNLHYVIIEKNPANDSNSLPGNVTWLSDASSLQDIKGCVLSNELIDNFPVHRVVMHDDLMEILVDYENNFKEVVVEASCLLSDYFKRFNIVLPREYTTEVNLEVKNWVIEIAGFLKAGFVLTFDYGFLSEQLYDDSRYQGTLTCFHQHHLNYNPYINIGKQDITAHVNFSDLYRLGLENGFEYAGYTNQLSFLSALGLNRALNEIEKSNPSNLFSPSSVHRFIQSFLREMGRAIKVLALQKNMPGARLTGAQFSQYLA